MNLTGSANARCGTARAIRKLEKRISENVKSTTKPARIRNVIGLKQKNAGRSP